MAVLVSFAIGLAVGLFLAGAAWALCTDPEPSDSDGSTR